MTNLPTFGQLLAEYMSRLGISDSELARSIGVRRQTIFRWKEGLVERPRSRDDVLQCAKKLRLTAIERDRLLLAAGFAPDMIRESSSGQAATSNQPLALHKPGSEREPASISDDEQAWANEPSSQEMTSGEPLSPLLVSPLTDSSITPSSTPLAPLSKATAAEAALTEQAPMAAGESITPATEPPPSPLMKAILHLFASRSLRWWPLGGVLLVVGLLALVWGRSASFWNSPAPTPAPPATVVLYPPPQTTPTAQPTALVAREGETLLLIAQFKGYTPNATYNVAGRIREELEQQITTAGLIGTTVHSWPEEITNVMRARELLTTTKATLVLWGEYDSGRVRVNLEARDPKASQSANFDLTPDDELVTTINKIVPKDVRNTALLILGTLVRDQAKYSMAVGRRLRELGNDEAAAAVFQHALDLQPTDPETEAWLNFYLGYLAAKSEQVRDYERAIAYYSRAIALDPKLYNALYNRGTLQIKLAQKAPANETLILDTLNAAIADLTTVITRQPTYVNAYLNRAIAYYERDLPDDMAAALADLDHVIAVKADYALAYYSRGLAHIRHGQGLQWVADFQQALALQPDYPDAVSGLCWGYALAQQAEKALTYCDQAVKYDDTGASRDSRALVYAQLGRYADAVVDFRAYLDWLESQSPLVDYARGRGPLVEQWITALEAGQNPFERALLEQLRHRDHD